MCINRFPNLDPACSYANANTHFLPYLPNKRKRCPNYPFSMSLVFFRPLPLLPPPPSASLFLLFHPFLDEYLSASKLRLSSLNECL